MASNETVNGGVFNIFFNELLSSPINILLVIVIVLLIYKIARKRYSTNVLVEEKQMPSLPKLRKDMTSAEMRPYDGTQPDGRVLVAVNGFVFDVTKGRRFYGPGGMYAAFGGRDASRGLATFSVQTKDCEYDDLSDLNSQEMDSVREWEIQFREKYELVGRLLRHGEEPTSYSDEDVEEVDRESSNLLESTKKNE